MNYNDPIFVTAQNRLLDSWLYNFNEAMDNPVVSEHIRDAIGEFKAHGTEMQDKNLFAKYILLIERVVWHNAKSTSNR